MDLKRRETTQPPAGDATPPGARGGVIGRMLAGASILLLLVAAGAILITSPPRLEVKVVDNPLVNPPGIIDANNSPTLVRNPQRPADLAVAQRVDRPRFSAAIEWSGDGGTTWQATALPLPAGLDRPYAPDIAFGPDGTLYVLYVNLTGPGNVPDNLWLARSTDGGGSLEQPVRVAGRLAFQARLAVVPRDGAVVITWLQATDVGLLRLSGPPSPVVAVRSTDGGHTFSPPGLVSDPERARVGAATPIVDDQGGVVVLYEDFKADRRDFENLDGPAWDGAFALVVTRSPDEGRSFGRGVEVDSDVRTTRRFLVFLPDFPSIAAGPDGAMYVAWADGGSGHEEILVRRSDDGGRTWGPRRQASPAGGTGQTLPRVAIAPDGRVDVVFLERLNGERLHAMLASSLDGRSYQDVRLSTAPSDARVGPSTAPYLGVDFGSRLGIVSSDTGVDAAWTDTRFGTVDTGRQDIVFTDADVRRSRSPAGARVLVAVGLADVAAAVAIVAVVRRGRRLGR